METFELDPGHPKVPNPVERLEPWLKTSFCFSISSVLCVFFAVVSLIHSFPSLGAALAVGAILLGFGWLAHFVWGLCALGWRGMLLLVPGTPVLLMLAAVVAIIKFLSALCDTC